ncbi:MAG: ABC transporter substrate-binding protein [Actinobacteria bacterium]|nr:ABC transporter substrate-binding protein [Actinomycetota bacterium]
MFLRKTSLLLAIVLIAALVLSGCGSKKTPEGPSQAKDKKSDIIRIGLDVDAGTADPRLARDSSAFRITDLVFDGLVRLDANLVPQASLAEKWDNPDPTTWIFYLRKGVKFHDGQELTSEDVKYTYDTILDEKFKAPYRALYTPIEKIEAPDKYTVKFKLKSPYAPLMSYLDMGIVPKHVAEKPEGNFASKPVGTGPYRMVSWTKNNKIEFEAFKDYWAGAPKSPKVTYFIIPDNTTRVAALEAGDVDLVHSPLSPQDIARMKDKAGFKVISTTGLGFTYLNFNTQNPILKDVKVRQAIAHLVDKQTLSSKIYQGMDKPGISVLLPGTWAYSDSIKTQPYDLKKAAELFAQAGWKDTNNDGVLDKDGRKLAITLKTHTEDPNRIQAVEFLQNEFKKAGIEVKVVTTEWPTFSASVMKGDYDIALLGWLSLVDPDRAMYNQFHSKGGTNWEKYSNPRVDQLLDQGRTTLEQDKRRPLYQEAAQIIADEVPYDVILYQGYVVMMGDKVKGFEVNPRGSLFSLWKTEVGK